ncbi:CopG family transcriptional regulator [Sulfolobaceae archaeon RB850M]
MNKNRINNKGIFLRLNDQDKELLRSMAKYYGVAEADVIRIALKEFVKNHGLGASS